MRCVLRWLVSLGLASGISVGCVNPNARAALPPRSDRVSEVFPRVIGSVVLIEVTIRDFESRSGRMTSMPGVGSGVLISKDGNILTAAHVVNTADSIKVYFGDGEPVPAKVISVDVFADVALIDVDTMPDAAKPARLADSNKQNVGDEVFVVGAPLGVSHTLTVGHLSARRKPAAMTTGLSNAELFQTDAAINQGNSGGPLFNMRGEVIGIVSHMITVSGGFDGLGFAVTANAARELLLERDAFWGGVASYRLDGPLAQAFNLPQSSGLLVQVVAKGSPAQRLGLRGGNIPATIGDEQMLVGGDVILAIQGIPVDSSDPVEIRKALVELKPGDAMTVRVLRDGQVRELEGPYIAN